MKLFPAVLTVGLTVRIHASKGSFVSQETFPTEAPLTGGDFTVCILGALRQFRDVLVYTIRKETF